MDCIRSVLSERRQGNTCRNLLCPDHMERRHAAEVCGQPARHKGSKQGIPFDPGASLKDPQIYDPQGHPLQTVSIASGSYLDFVSALQSWRRFLCSISQPDDGGRRSDHRGAPPIRAGRGRRPRRNGDDRGRLEYAGLDLAPKKRRLDHDRDQQRAGVRCTARKQHPYIRHSVPRPGDWRLGTNPWGGTLSFQGVNQVAVGNIGGEYIIAGNNGDTINSGFGALQFAGNALIIGGTGNDTINGWRYCRGVWWIGHQCHCCRNRP